MGVAAPVGTFYASHSLKSREATTTHAVGVPRGAIAELFVTTERTLAATDISALTLPTDTDPFSLGRLLPPVARASPALHRMGKRGPFFWLPLSFLSRYFLIGRLRGQIEVHSLDLSIGLAFNSHHLAGRHFPRIVTIRGGSCFGTAPAVVVSRQRQGGAGTITQLAPPLPAPHHPCSARPLFFAPRPLPLTPRAPAAHMLSFLDSIACTTIACFMYPLAMFSRRSTNTFLSASWHTRSFSVVASDTLCCMSQPPRHEKDNFCQINRNRRGQRRTVPQPTARPPQATQST